MLYSLLRGGGGLLPEATSRTIVTIKRIQPIIRTTPYGMPLGTCDIQRNAVPPPVQRVVAANIWWLGRLQRTSDVFFKLASLSSGTHTGIKAIPRMRSSISIRLHDWGMPLIMQKECDDLQRYSKPDICSDSGCDLDLSGSEWRVH